MGGEQSKQSVASKTSRATRGERGTAGSSSSAMDKTPGSSKPGKDEDEKDEEGIVGEGLLGEGRFLEVPRRAHNVCGVFEEIFLIMEPFDDQMERDLAIYNIFNFMEPWKVILTFFIQDGLLWFIRGETNKKTLSDRGLKIRDANGSRNF
uniref:Uncharacterized protein n=1 Tax=Meloidogyne hapla TaxID=6305 RepID=A0A1I8BKI4_MELHA